MWLQLSPGPRYSLNAIVMTGTATKQIISKVYIDHLFVSRHMLFFSLEM